MATSAQPRGRQAGSRRSARIGPGPASCTGWTATPRVLYPPSPAAALAQPRTLHAYPPHIHASLPPTHIHASLPCSSRLSPSPGHPVRARRWEAGCTARLPSHGKRGNGGKAAPRVSRAAQPPVSPGPPAGTRLTAPPEDAMRPADGMGSSRAAHRLPHGTGALEDSGVQGAGGPA